MKKKKPILNLQKGCPFCGNTNLVSGYNPTQNETKIACTDCAKKRKAMKKDWERKINND